MASQTSTLFDNTNNVATSGIQNRATDDGKLRVIVDTFTTTSALTAGSHTLALCKLPKGAKVVSAELIVPASVGTTSAKLGVFALTSAGAVGDAIDDDRYGSAVNLSTAGRKQFITVAADADYVTTAEVAVVLSPVTVDFATAIAFGFVIMYTTGN
jgi:hypothetical protein